MSIPLPSTPRPGTTSAVLMCPVEKKPTQHVYSRKKELQGENKHRTATDFIFRCEGCGVERVWGREE